MTTTDEHAGDGPGKTRRFRPVVILILGFVLVSSIIVTVTVSVRQQSRKVACANNLRQIGIASTMYMNQYRTFPHKDVFQEALRDASGRSSLDPDSCSYLWAAEPQTDETPVTVPLAACNPDGHTGGRNILFVGGTVRWTSAEEFEEKYRKHFPPE